MKIKVLVADSDSDIIELVKMVLERSDKYELLQARSNTEIVEVAKQHPDIKVVILDTDCLSHGSVTDVVRKLCEGCKFLLFTGSVKGLGDPQEFGVDAIVMKPSQPHELLMKLSSLCSQDVLA